MHQFDDVTDQGDRVNAGFFVIRVTVKRPVAYTVQDISQGSVAKRNWVMQMNLQPANPNYTTNVPANNQHNNIASRELRRTVKMKLYLSWRTLQGQTHYLGTYKKSSQTLVLNGACYFSMFKQLLFLSYM